MVQEFYPVTQKEMQIICMHCFHPYWNKCGGLNPCEYFDENRWACKFEVKDFMDLLCKRNLSNASLL